MNRLSVEEASARILEDIAPVDAETIAIREALGRVLHHDVLSPVTLPPWDNASMDGYAVRAEDVRAASPEHPVALPVVETIAAGQTARQELRGGTAMRIMTGAPIPAGADSVIRVEDSDGGTTIVLVRDARDALKNVRPRGEDLRAGEVAVPAGTIIGPAHIGVLASVGAARLEVHRRPRVAILASGDELVDIDGFGEVLGGRRIVSSNSYSIAAAVTQAGGQPMELGIAPDQPEHLRACIERARGADLLITCGGISVGAFDFTKDVLQQLGAELRFWRVRMRPGAPVGFGLVCGMPWLGLPGNPVSALVTFELFGRPAIRKLRGEQRIFRRPAHAVVDEAIAINAPLVHFLRAVVRPQPDGVLHASLTGPQGSGLLTSMARANALLVIAADRERVGAGELVPALLLNDDAESAPVMQLA